jgi:hypothetical protein
LRAEHAAVASEVEGLQAHRDAARDDCQAAVAAAAATAASVDAHVAAIGDLSATSDALLHASSLSAEVAAALAALDRRQLAEVAKLGAPPAAVKKALETVQVFLAVFGGSDEGGLGGGGGGASQISPRKKPPTRTQSNSDVRSPSKTSPSKAASTSPNKSPTKNKNGPQPFAFRERSWEETRKQMATDLRPQILGITPEALAADEHADSLATLAEMMRASVDAAAIARASKPTGVLHAYCKALLECAVSIRARRVVQTHVAALEAQTAELDAARAAAEADLPRCQVVAADAAAALEASAARLAAAGEVRGFGALRGGGRQG